MNPLAKVLAERIATAGGWLPFDQFMQAALYEPQLGYYEQKSEQKQIFGPQGDFVTAASMGPWFSLALTDLVVWCWQQLGQPEEWRLLEQGGGTGVLLGQLLPQLKERGVTPATIISVERSGALRQRQQLAAAGWPIAHCASLAELTPSANLVLFSNELPDAFPVRGFCWRDGRFVERGVGLSGDSFVWQERELADPPQIPPAIIEQWPDGYCGEWSPAQADWQQQLAAKMVSGFNICVDYGYSNRELYRPGRREGSLLAHLKHQAVEDVLADPGSRDLTAHVDFSAIIEAGRSAGLLPLCYQTQGSWLAQSPAVANHLQTIAARSDVASEIAHAKRLMLPTGMGEMFKLLLQTKGVEAACPDYLRGLDRLGRL